MARSFIPTVAILNNTGGAAALQSDVNVFLAGNRNINLVSIELSADGSTVLIHYEVEP